MPFEREKQEFYINIEEFEGMKGEVPLSQELDMGDIPW